MNSKSKSFKQEDEEIGAADMFGNLSEAANPNDDNSPNGFGGGRFGRKRPREVKYKKNGEIKLAGSATGLCVKQLQDLLPKARVVYCSATGVSELANMVSVEQISSKTKCATEIAMRRASI
jgi:hypothetical protein